MGEISRPDGLDFQVPERTEVRIVDVTEILDSLEKSRKRMKLGPGGLPLSDLRSGNKPGAEGEQSS